MPQRCGDQEEKIMSVFKIEVQFDIPETETTNPDIGYEVFGVRADHHRQHVWHETTLCGVGKAGIARLSAAAKKPGAVLRVEVGGNMVILAGWE
jgi:hypothetical protein